MTKRLVEIDDDLLERARTASGEKTIRATVEAALRRLVDDEVAIRHVEHMRQPGAVDLQAIDEANRPRVPLRD